MGRLTMAGPSRVAVAVERYRRDHDQQVPQALTDLVPRYLTDIPHDPYSESTLLYKRTDAEYVIYSVGPNGTDDGGDLTPGKPRWPQGQPTASHDLGLAVQVVR
jgi:hypothetical protein